MRVFTSWLTFSIAALLIWGAWGFFANLTARYLGGFSALVWEVVGAAITGVVVLVWLIRYEGLEAHLRGVSFGIATGISYTVGLAFLFFALNYAGNRNSDGMTAGNVHTVLILTALYPVMATLLNYLILDEPLSLRQITGMAVGLAGIAILVSE